MLGRLICIAILACVSVALADSPSETIPLKDIWAWQMPGTKSIAELESDSTGQVPKSDSDLVLTFGIRQTLGKRPDQLRDAFAVLGSGHKSLEEAHAVFTGTKKPQTNFNPGQDISIVFFSYRMGVYAHLDSVERRGNTIEIHYKLVPHYSADVTEHFALIPIGKLPVGEFKVNIVQSPINTAALRKELLGVDEESANKFVCKSFVFSVGALEGGRQ